MTVQPMGAWQGVFGGAGDGSQGPGTLPTIAQVACGIHGQVYTAEDLPGRGQAWDGATMTYVAQIDTGAHDVSDSFAVAASPLDGSVAIISHGPYQGPGNYVQWFQENLVWIRKVGVGGVGPGKFGELEGVAFDGAGNLYTFDTDNGVQKWDATTGAFVAVTGLQGVEADTVVLTDGLRCIYYASDFDGLSIWDTAGLEVVRLKNETGTNADANAWYLPPGVGTGNAGCHIYTTRIYTTALSSTKVWKYTQAGTLVATYLLDLTQRGADLVLTSIRAERTFAFAVSGDETQLMLGTQPNDGGANRAWIYKFNFPPSPSAADSPPIIHGRGAC